MSWDERGSSNWNTEFESFTTTFLGDRKPVIHPSFTEEETEAQGFITANTWSRFEFKIRYMLDIAVYSGSPASNPAFYVQEFYIPLSLGES